MEKGLNKNRLEFRAFHKPTHRLFNVYTFSKDFVFEETIDGIGTSETNPAKFKDCIIEQCTGLKDNNGRLIFEGDIICTDKTVGVVKLGKYGGNDWEGWHFGYYIDWLRYADINNRKPTLRKDFWFWVEHREIEIIGNIHQNKELLK